MYATTSSPLVGPESKRRSPAFRPALTSARAADRVRCSSSSLATQVPSGSRSWRHGGRPRPNPARRLGRELDGVDVRIEQLVHEDNDVARFGSAPVGIDHDLAIPLRSRYRMNRPSDG